MTHIQHMQYNVNCTVVDVIQHIVHLILMIQSVDGMSDL